MVVGEVSDVQVAPSGEEAMFPLPPTAIWSPREGDQVIAPSGTPVVSISQLTPSTDDHFQVPIPMNLVPFHTTSFNERGLNP